MDPSSPSHQEYPKDFVKDTDVLPFDKYGISSLLNFQDAQKDLQDLEKLKKCGLSDEEIKLYHENEAGDLTQENVKIPSEVLELKLKAIYCKIQSGDDGKNTSSEQASSSTSVEVPSSTTSMKYPPGHPMNDIKSLAQDLFGSSQEVSSSEITSDNKRRKSLDEISETPDSNSLSPMKSIKKRRKILRRLEERTKQIMAEDPHSIPSSSNIPTQPEAPKNPKSLWDVKEVDPKPGPSKKPDEPLGPKLKTMYTIRDNKIIRLETGPGPDEMRGVDIVIPVNRAEERLLEGTKMCVDDIRKIERFKDYEPGVPSKVLYLKNIAPSVTTEQLSILFNQFILNNGGPIDVRLLEGRMRGQAFVAFQNEETAVSALEDINGTILMGRPIIAQFGRNSNRILDE